MATDFVDKLVKTKREKRAYSQEQIIVSFTEAVAKACQATPDGMIKLSLLGFKTQKERDALFMGDIEPTLDLLTEFCACFNLRLDFVISPAHWVKSRNRKDMENAEAMEGTEFDFALDEILDQVDWDTEKLWWFARTYLRDTNEKIARDFINYMRELREMERAREK